MFAKLFTLFHKNPYLLWLLVIINLAGTIFGFYYYCYNSSQCVSTPWYLLPFVPDSPTATLMIALALILIFFKKESPLVNTFAYFGLIKVGFWTLFTMVVYKHFFFAPDNLIYYGTLFILHAGMIAEAFVLKDKLKFQLKYWFPVALFYLINDFSDYYLGTVPTPLPLGRVDLLPFLAIESALVTTLLVYYFYRKSSKSEENEKGFPNIAIGAHKQLK